MSILGEVGMGSIPMTTTAEIIPNVLDLIIAGYGNDAEADALKEVDSIVFLINLYGSENYDGMLDLHEDCGRLLRVKRY